MNHEESTTGKLKRIERWNKKVVRLPIGKIRFECKNLSKQEYELKLDYEAASLKIERVY